MRNAVPAALCVVLPQYAVIPESPLPMWTWAATIMSAAVPDMLCCEQWKVAPALAAGNTAVLKPSEVCSVTCLELAAVAHEVGLPAGVLNVVCGYGADAGAPLRCEHIYNSSLLQAVPFAS